MENELRYAENHEYETRTRLHTEILELQDIISGKTESYPTDTEIRVFKFNQNINEIKKHCATWTKVASYCGLHSSNLNKLRSGCIPLGPKTYYRSFEGLVKLKIKLIEGIGKKRIGDSSTEERLLGIIESLENKIFLLNGRLDKGLEQTSEALGKVLLLEKSVNMLRGLTTYLPSEVERLKLECQRLSGNQAWLHERLSQPLEAPSKPGEAEPGEGTDRGLKPLDAALSSGQNESAT